MVVVSAIIRKGDKKLIFISELIAGMKILRSTLFFTITALLYSSCQRELFFDGVSAGGLKKDASGNCLPLFANGIFIVDTILNHSNFIEVQADVIKPGTYNIKSDTVNGFSFNNAGTVTKGTNTIRLYANGKPIATGNTNFNITYGTSTCNFIVKVSNTPAAEFILGGAPNFCSGALDNGPFIKGIPLTPANTITVQANVTATGRYSLTASTNNGFQFAGNGVFIFTGIQNVTLTGIGTPIREEVSTVTVTNSISTCNFDIKVIAQNDGKAVFSFDGTPGDCISYIVNGDYYAGITETVNNTVTLKVSVSKAGTYSIFTNMANGISFSGAGVFVNIGQQNVTLAATGTPIRNESTAFIPNTGTQSCNFLVNVQPKPPPAVFTLAGAPNTCSSVTVNGFYIVSKPLDAANTVLMQVDVTVAGSYALSTNTVNGITFSTAGVFSTTGLQNIILHGSGVPQAMGPTIIMPNSGTSACTFSLTVQ